MLAIRGRAKISSCTYERNAVTGHFSEHRDPVVLVDAELGVQASQTSEGLVDESTRVVDNVLVRHGLTVWVVVGGGRSVSRHSLRSRVAGRKLKI